MVLAAVSVAASCGGSGASNPSVTIERSPERIAVHSASLTAAITRPHFRLIISARGSGDLLLREPRGGGLFYEREGQAFRVTRVSSDRPLHNGIELTVETDEAAPAAGTVTLRYVTDRTLEVTFEPPGPEGAAAFGERWEAAEGEMYYGLTERLRDSPVVAPGLIDIPVDDIQPPEAGSLNRRGEIVEMVVRPTIALYAPFYHSSRGYGLLVSGTTFGSFDLAASDPQVSTLRFESGSTAKSRRLRFYVFFGPDHPTILDEYTALTGRPAIPPGWAFRPWRWRDELPAGETGTLDGVTVNAKVAEDVAMFEQLGIPPGVMVFDRPVLSGDYGFARFEWDEERIPNPEAMLAALHGRGFHTLFWSSMWACGSEAGDNGLYAKQFGFLAPGAVAEDPPRCDDLAGTNFILDVTNPEARNWFRNQIAAFTRRYAMNGIKLDRGEEHIPSEASDLWADGRTGREVRNDYQTLQAKLHNEALRDVYPDGDFVLITRSGYTGTQHYAIAWGGDTAGSESFGRGAGTDLGLRSAIISQQRAAFMGYPVWGSDTGGYYEFKDRDVFARWIEFSAFSGIMEIGGKGTHAPWDMPTEPAYDDEMIAIYRRYTNLRASMSDYIVAAAREARESGLPIVRPMVFLDRSDSELGDLWDQYLFGPDLMVAPVWRIGQRSRDVYFPRGEWHSFWNESETFTGPAISTVAAPLDTIPVFVRAGASTPGAPG